jgi:hypothetical protein
MQIIATTTIAPSSGPCDPLLYARIRKSSHGKAENSPTTFSAGPGKPPISKIIIIDD